MLTSSITFLFIQNIASLPLPYRCVPDGRQDVDGAQSPQRVHRLQRPAERLVEDVTNPGSAAPAHKKHSSSGVNPSTNKMEPIK